MNFLTLSHAFLKVLDTGYVLSCFSYFFSLSSKFSAIVLLILCFWFPAFIFDCGLTGMVGYKRIYK